MYTLANMIVFKSIVHWEYNSSNGKLLEWKIVWMENYSNVSKYFAKASGLCCQEFCKMCGI